jgi:outer membrane biosynthesis protein TonB
MSRTASPPQPLSGSKLLVGLSAYAACLLLGFAFGWIAGSRSGRTVELAQAEPSKQPDAPKFPEVKPSDNTLSGRVAALEKPTVESSAPPVAKKEPPKAEPPKAEPPKKESPKAEPKKQPEPKKEPPKTEPAPATTVTFTKDILPVFRKYCIDCHSGPKPKGSVDVTTVAMIMKGGKNGRPILKAGDPANSSIFVTVEEGTMPPEGKAPTDAEKKLIKDWIAGGAK